MQEHGGWQGEECMVRKAPAMIIMVSNATLPNVATFPFFPNNHTSVFVCFFVGMHRVKICGCDGEEATAHAVLVAATSCWS